MTKSDIKNITDKYRQEIDNKYYLQDLKKISKIILKKAKKGEYGVNIKQDMLKSNSRLAFDNIKKQLERLGFNVELDKHYGYRLRIKWDSNE